MIAISIGNDNHQTGLGFLLYIINTAKEIQKPQSLKAVIAVIT